MQITNKQTVSISPQELKDIVVDHLKYKGIYVSDVRFKISAQEDPNDWSASFPLTFVLSEIICE